MTEFAVQSPLEPDEARRRLAEAVASPGMGGAMRDLRPFVGHFDGRQFDVMMSSRGRNSFRPRMRGSLEPSGGGTRLTGTLERSRAVLIFLLLFLSMPVSLSASALMADLAAGRWEPEVLIVPAVLLLFITGVVFAFAHETRRALRAIAALLDGDLTSHTR